MREKGGYVPFHRSAFTSAEIELCQAIGLVRLAHGVAFLGKRYVVGQAQQYNKAEKETRWTHTCLLCGEKMCV